MPELKLTSNNYNHQIFYFNTSNHSKFNLNTTTPLISVKKYN